MRLSALLICCLLLLLGACSQARPRPVPAANCDYGAVMMTVAPGHTRLAATAANRPGTQDAFVAEAADRFAATLREKVLARRQLRAAETLRDTAAGTADHDQYLVLSGGGPHGAFGAGFFYGMRYRPSPDTVPAVPIYDIVTGISTGSLQSTLLFLANQPVPDDRDYGWVDGPLARPNGSFEPHQGRSNIDDLALAYSIAREGDLLRLQLGGDLGIVFKGAAANFGPLRARLKALISPKTLDQVAEQGIQEKRSLYVGVVNLDDGAGYAIDMTRLAARGLGASDAVRRQVQDCYVSALLASSSVPPGVPPITLFDSNGEHMFLDGGARFGVFLEQVLRAMGQQADPKAQVTVMVNTALYGASWSKDGAPEKRWSAITFGLRAVDVMENQVYRFSVADAEQFGQSLGGMDMAFISNENIPGGELPDDHVFVGMSCAQWAAIDKREKPLQFYPNYMACLADYGRVRGLGLQWNRHVRGGQAVALPAPAAAR